MENNLVGQTDLDIAYNAEAYPYKPDINFGYKGQKILLSVLPSSKTMSDVDLPDGEFVFHSKILKALSDQPIQTVGVPVAAVVDIDIENLKLGLKKSFDFIECIKKQLDSSEPAWRHSIDFDGYSNFGASLARGLMPYFDSSAVSMTDKRRVNSFFHNFLRVFQLKQ